MRELIFTGVHDYNNDKIMDNVRVNMNGAWAQYLDCDNKVFKEEQIVFGYSGVAGNPSQAKGSGDVGSVRTNVTLQVNPDRSTSAVLHIENINNSGFLFYQSLKF